MAYITFDDFAAYSPSMAAELTQEEFEELAERASDVIDAITYDRISRRGGLDKFQDWIQQSVKKAACAQVQTLQTEGGVDVVASGSASATGESIGKYSYSGGSNAVTSLRIIDGTPLSPLIRGYLARTGMLYAGVCACV